MDELKSRSYQVERTFDLFEGFMHRINSHWNCGARLVRPLRGSGREAVSRSTREVPGEAPDYSSMSHRDSLERINGMVQQHNSSAENL